MVEVEATTGIANTTFFDIAAPLIEQLNLTRATKTQTLEVPRPQLARIS